VIYRGPFIPTVDTDGTLDPKPDTTQGVDTAGGAGTPTLNTSPVISQPSADQRITTDGLWLRFERPLPVGGWHVTSVAKSVEGLVAKEFPDGRSADQALRAIRSAMTASRC